MGRRRLGARVRGTHRWLSFSIEGYAYNTRPIDLQAALEAATSRSTRTRARAQDAAPSRRGISSVRFAHSIARRSGERAQQTEQGATHIGEPAAAAMPLVYAFVARRDGTILAEHTQVAGNFASVAQECLNNLKDSDEKFTVTADGYTFNFLTHGAYGARGMCARCVCDARAQGNMRAPAHTRLNAKHPRHTLNAVYLGVADEAYGRAIPFAFLDRARAAFAEKFADKGLASAPRGLDRTFGCVRVCCGLAVCCCCSHAMLDRYAFG